MNGAKERGDRGEALAAEYLRARGYRIVETNWRCRRGEIDLIAEKDGVLSFVEVKLRSGLSHGLPREFVTAKKQEKLRAAALLYLSVHGLDVPARFDVAEVYARGGEAVHIEYIEDAF